MSRTTDSRKLVVLGAYAAALLLAGPARAGTLPVPMQVTTTGGRSPTVSQDHLWVAYRSAVGIERIRLADAKVETLAVGNLHDPDWSWVHDLILFSDDGLPGGLRTVDPTTKVVQPFNATGGSFGNAVWSFLGDEIVAQNTSPDGLALLSYPGAVFTPVPCIEPDQTSCSGENPTMSPDGQWIAFEDGPITKVGRAGGQAVHVTTRLGGHASWSPDGEWIAFVEFGGTFPDVWSHLWVVDARGASFGEAQFTDGTFRDARPTWSPQSNAIYFESNRSGTLEVWKVDFDPALPAQPTTWGRLKASRR